MTQREITYRHSKDLPSGTTKTSAAPQVQIMLFGAFVVIRDHVAITSFPGNKIRALLALLATEADRPHTRARLVALLWPEQSETLALRNLSQTLVRLRKTLGDTSTSSPLITVTRATLQWNQASNASIDVVQFLRLCESQVLSDLAEAVALYRGDFLQGFHVVECEAFEEWQTRTREHVRQSVLTALHTLTEAAIAAGKMAEAERYARQQIALDPWREESHRQVMRVLAATAQRAAALAHYAACRKLLHDDLGIDPDPATTALFAEISAKRIGETRPRFSTRPPNSSKSRIPRRAAHTLNLPAALTPLLGRADELSKLVALLQRTNARLVTLTGQGGVGKTRLALAAALQLQPTFANGVCWVPLAGVAAAPPDRAPELVAAIVRALGQTVRGPEDVAAQCIRLLRQQKLLLVLDNMEHLLAGTAFVLELLQAAPHVQILVTSRERLNVAAEHVLALTGLAVPSNEREHDAASYSAITLFVERAQQQVPGFGQGGATLEAMVRLCRILEGLPLGIELAAHWVAHYSCDEIAHAITTNSAFLATSSRDYSPRHRSLHAVFTYSWHLLAPEPQRALMQLSVFRSAFDRTAAQAITQADAKTLGSLVDSSLLRRVGTGRYVLHELVRQFAAEQLRQHNEEQFTHARHAAYYLRWVALHAEHMFGPQRHHALTAIEAALENVQAAWNWAVDSSDGALMTETIDGIGAFYYHRGRYHEAYTACARVIARFDTGALVSESTLLLGQALAWQAAFAITLRPLPQARALLERSLTVLDVPQAQRIRAFVYYLLGRLSFLESDLAAAQRMLTYSLNLYNTHNDQAGAALTLGMLGRLAWLMGDYAQARHWYTNSLTAYRARDDHMGSIRITSDLAMVTVLAGQHDAGMELFEASRVLIDTLTGALEIVQARRHLANALLNVGQYVAAQTPYEQCLAITDTYEHASFQINDRLMLSFAYLMQRRYRQVTELAQAAFAAAHALGLQRDAGFAMLMLGLAELGRKHYAQARKTLQECLSVYQVTNTADDQSFTLFGLSQAHRGLGDVVQARQAAISALHLAVHGHSARAEGMALGALVGVFADEQDWDRAIELDVLVMRHPVGANSGFFHDFITQPLAERAAHLPADVVARARARGRARALTATVAELRVLLDEFIP